LGTAPSAAERRIVLLVDYPLFAHDFAAWLGLRGYQVEWLVPQALNVEMFGKVCRVLAPLFVASINFSPELALLCTMAKTPYLSWTVDPLGAERFRLYPGTDPALALAFAHRRETVERLRAIGFGDAEYLPLAASGRRQALPDDPELERYRTPISFVGSSLAQEGQALAQGLVSHDIEPELVGAFAELVESLLEQHEGDVAYAGLAPDCSALPGVLLARLPAGLDLGKLAELVNGALSHRLRVRRVEALAPLGISVYGDTGWQGRAAGYVGIADHGDELTRIYNASLLNLDVPRIYQRDIATMRVFDIMACGGVVLSEPSPDLLELFTDGSELVCYSSARELSEKSARLLAFEQERASIGRAAYAAVRREHLLEHRFERLAAGLARRGFVKPRA
jgi:spore maturation protein CgeB